MTIVFPTFPQFRRLLVSCVIPVRKNRQVSGILGYKATALELQPVMRRLFRATLRRNGQKSPPEDKGFGLHDWNHNVGGGDGLSSVASRYDLGSVPADPEKEFVTARRAAPANPATSILIVFKMTSVSSCASSYRILLS
jgi:hypothetical protein